MVFKMYHNGKASFTIPSDYMTLEEFYKKIPDWISKNKSEWNHITVLSYFLYKYEKSHGVRFRMAKWKGHPAKNKECKDFANLIKLFKEDYTNNCISFSNEDLMIKMFNYINWMFDFKFKRGNKSISGTRFFLIPSIINEFERMYSSFLKTRSSKDKFHSLREWIVATHPDALLSYQFDDLNDLKILARYAHNYSLDSNSIEVKIINKAKSMGAFDE